MNIVYQTESGATYGYGAAITAAKSEADFLKHEEKSGLTPDQLKEVHKLATEKAKSLKEESAPKPVAVPEKKIEAPIKEPVK